MTEPFAPPHDLAAPASPGRELAARAVPLAMLAGAFVGAWFAWSTSQTYLMFGAEHFAAATVGVGLVRTVASAWAVAVTVAAAATLPRRERWVGSVIALCWAPILATGWASSALVFSRYAVPVGFADYAKWIDPSDLAAGVLGLVIRATVATVAWWAVERRSYGPGARLFAALVVTFAANGAAELLVPAPS